MSELLQVNGWTILAHPLLLDQIERLVSEVERRKDKDPKTYKRKNCTKRLKAVLKLIAEDVPADPASAAFRQGKTLGEARKHWFRAKFYQQYRLFFRYDGRAKIIVFAWMNDEGTKRAYGSKTDAYGVFRSMLEDGNPPDDFDALMEEARQVQARLAKVMEADDR